VIMSLIISESLTCKRDTRQRHWPTCQTSPKHIPTHLLVRDSQVSYADALLLEGQAAEATSLLERLRRPNPLGRGICIGARLRRIRADGKSR
jgi:hypothetical protein